MKTEIDIQSEIKMIIKEGYLEKESRVFKTWRKRWFVLTPKLLLTYKESKVYSSPTESIELKDIVSIKSSDEETHKECSFRLDTYNEIFYILASSNTEKEQWIGQIGKAMVKATRKNEDD